MNKLTLTLAALLLIVGSALGESFRVIVQAQSSREARRTVMDMLPGAVVTRIRSSAIICF